MTNRERAVQVIQETMRGIYQLPRVPRDAYNAAVNATEITINEATAELEARLAEATAETGKLGASLARSAVRAIEAEKEVEKLQARLAESKAELKDWIENRGPRLAAEANNELLAEAYAARKALCSTLEQAIAQRDKAETHLDDARTALDETNAERVRVRAALKHMAADWRRRRTAYGGISALNCIEELEQALRPEQPAAPPRQAGEGERNRD